MFFKPIDEMSLRQLFSTDYAKNILKIAYLGPVINASGRVEPSPDALVLDMRSIPYVVKRCEFKFSPLGINDFAHNGNFDIAIIWSFPPGGRNLLEVGLRERNQCQEVIALSDFNCFSGLNDYNMDSLRVIGSCDAVAEVAINRPEYTVVAAYIFAKNYTKIISVGDVVSYLSGKFPEVRAMLPQGRGNSVSSLAQTNPPLILNMNQRNYRWNSKFDPIQSCRILERVIVNNFASSIPDISGIC